jgi:hypothetical protein
MQRWIAGDLAVFNISNGLAMLFASSTWWASVPGERDTDPSPQEAAPDRHARLLSAFCEAAASGDISGLAGLLREDAIAITDGGGRKIGALNRSRARKRSSASWSASAGKNAGRDIASSR